MASKREAAEQAAATPMESLPFDARTLIFSFTAPRDVVHISTTCTSFAEHATADSLWDALALRAFPHIGLIKAKLRCPTSSKALYRQQLAKCTPRQHCSSIADYALSFHFGERGHREAGKSAMHLFVEDVFSDVCAETGCTSTSYYHQNQDTIMARLQQRWGDVDAGAKAAYEAAAAADSASRSCEPTKRVTSAQYCATEHGMIALNVPDDDIHAFGQLAMASPQLVIDVHSIETGDLCKLILKAHDGDSHCWEYGPAPSLAQRTDTIESKNFFEQATAEQRRGEDDYTPRTSDNIFAHVELTKDEHGRFTSCSVDLCAVQVVHAYDQPCEIQMQHPFTYVLRLLQALPSTSMSGLCTSVNCAGFNAIQRFGQHALWEEQLWFTAEDQTNMNFVTHFTIARNLSLRVAAQR